MWEYSIVFVRENARQAAWCEANRRIDEIFVVPVCSMFANSPRAYLAFLQEAGVLERVADLVATANLRREDAAEVVRREVRAILTAAEVDVLTPPIPQITW